MREQHDDLLPMPATVRALTTLARAETAQAVLERTCAAARTLLPLLADASVTLLEPDGPRTAAADQELARRIDEAQYAAGDGPCMQAAATGRQMLVGDLAVEERWPAYTTAAMAAGVRASLSMPLRAGDALVGALNLYAGKPGAFDSNAIDVAADLVGYTTAILGAAEERQHAAAVAEQLRHAMESRAVIEQAKGILIAQHGGSADEAFAALVRLSQEAHRKLRDIAALLVEQAGRQRRQS